MTELLQLMVNGLVEGSVYALGAAGISLVFGPLRIVNFAQGDYLTFGAFAAVLANVGWGLDIASSTLFALVATAALAVALDFVPVAADAQARREDDEPLHHVDRARLHPARVDPVRGRKRPASVQGRRLPVLCDRRRPCLRAAADLDRRRSQRDRRDRVAAGKDELRSRRSVRSPTTSSSRRSPVSTSTEW